MDFISLRTLQDLELACFPEFSQARGGSAFAHSLAKTIEWALPLGKGTLAFCSNENILNSAEESQSSLGKPAEKLPELFSAAGATAPGSSGAL